MGATKPREAFTARQRAGEPIVSRSFKMTFFWQGRRGSIGRPGAPDMICVMKKEQLARRLAQERHVSPAVAADQLDRIVSDLLMKVRRG